MDIHQACTELESLFVTSMRPHFLSITAEDDDVSPYILIVISRPEYANIPIPERIQRCYNLIRISNVELLSSHEIFVQCFSNEELDDYLQYLF